MGSLFGSGLRPVPVRNFTGNCLIPIPDKMAGSTGMLIRSRPPTILLAGSRSGIIPPGEAGPTRPWDQELPHKTRPYLPDRKAGWTSPIKEAPPSVPRSRVGRSSCPSASISAAVGPGKGGEDPWPRQADPETVSTVHVGIQTKATEGD